MKKCSVVQNPDQGMRKYHATFLSGWPQFERLRGQIYSLKNKSSFEFWTLKSKIGLDHSYKATKVPALCLNVEI